MTNSEFIPVNTPLLGELELRYVTDCLKSGWISSEGPFVSEFEEKFSSRVERDHGVAVSNGSAALDIAVAALKSGPGDEVIMPSFTIISCPLAVVRAGAIPVLVDSDPQTWNMDVQKIEERITQRTKAIMVVHTYGLPVDIDSVQELAKKYNLFVIEDAAEMHGQFVGKRPCGSFGDISTFSFYPNKHLTTGEGGMLVTDDGDLAQRCKSLRNLCFKPERRFVHDELGWNYRMTSIQAALGLAQLEQLDHFVKKKRRLGSEYNILLSGAHGLILPPTSTKYANSIYWVYGLLLEDWLQLEATDVTEQLNQLGIGTRPFFWPIHEQPVFLKMGLFKEERYPVAEKMARLGFYLPSGLGLTYQQQIQVATTVHSVMSQFDAL